MSMLSVSDQEILRTLIAERGSGVIPTQGTAVQQVANSALIDPQGLGQRIRQSAPTGDIGYRAQTDNYRMDPRGNRGGDMMLDAAGAYGDLSGQFTEGLSRPARQAKAGVGRAIGKGGRRMAGKAAATISGIPGLAKAGSLIGVAAPALGAVSGALAVGDLVVGEESGLNKTMDAIAMGAGGILGSVGGPLGTAAGVGIGKMVSDGTQWLFGDKKTPEQRKMELALAQLQGSGVV